jgi:hypothetical protein
MAPAPAQYLPAVAGGAGGGSAQLPPGVPANMPAMMPAPSEDELFLQQLSTQLAYLKSKAGGAMTAAHWVEFIWSNQDDYAAILEAIERGATLENLFQFDSEIATNPVMGLFFRQLYDGLRTKLTSNSAPQWFIRNPEDAGNPTDPGAAGQPVAGAGQPGDKPGKPNSH